MENKFESESFIGRDLSRKPLPFYKKKRYLIVFLIFFGYFNLYTNRVNLSVAIVAMTENRTIQHEDGSVSYEKYFDWNSKEKGFALGAFFYGYVTTHILGGILATKYGGHLIFNFGLFGAAIFSALAPYMARHGIEYLIAIRIILGISSGFSFSSANDVLSRWIPLAERSRSASFTTAGINFGTFMANFVSGYISISLGWEWIFYTFSITTIIWCIIWFFTVHRSPETDTWITATEKQFIINSLADKNGEKAVTKPPWKSLLTSLPLWAIIVAHSSYTWGFFTMMTQLPSYMDEVLHFNLKNSAVISSLPYLAFTLVAFSSGFLADWIFKKNFLTVTQIRKYFNNFALLCQMTFLLIAAFSTDKTIIVICIILSVGLGGFITSGIFANTLDIAPQFSSIIYGISSTFAVIPGMVSPPLSGFIAVTPNASEYQIIFLIACLIYLFGTVFYGIFASGDVQQWALTKSNSEGEQIKLETADSFKDRIKK
ncbi:hypothetical protein ACKWTF_004679 [Chironomus riparius]